LSEKFGIAASVRRTDTYIVNTSTFLVDPQSYYRGQGTP